MATVDARSPLLLAPGAPPTASVAPRRRRVVVAALAVVAAVAAAALVASLLTTPGSRAHAQTHGGAGRGAVGALRPGAHGGVGGGNPPVPAGTPALLAGLYERAYNATTRTLRLSQDGLRNDTLFYMYGNLANAVVAVPETDCLFVGLLTATPALECRTAHAVFGSAAGEATLVFALLDKTSLVSAFSAAVDGAFQIDAALPGFPMDGRSWFNEEVAWGHGLRKGVATGSLAIASASFSVQLADHEEHLFDRGLTLEQTDAIAADPAGAGVLDMGRLSARLAASRFNFTVFVPLFNEHPDRDAQADIRFNETLVLQKTSALVVGGLALAVHGFDHDVTAALVADGALSAAGVGRPANWTARAEWHGDDRALDFAGELDLRPGAPWVPVSAASWLTAAAVTLDFDVAVGAPAPLTRLAFAADAEVPFAAAGTVAKLTGRGQADFASYVVQLSASAGSLAAAAAAALPAGAVPADSSAHDVALASGGQVAITLDNTAAFGLALSAESVRAVAGSRLAGLLAPLSGVAAAAGGSLDLNLDLGVDIFRDPARAELTLDAKATQLAGAVRLADAKLDLGRGLGPAASAALQGRLEVQANENDEAAVFTAEAAWAAGAPSVNLTGALQSWPHPFRAPWLDLTSGDVALAIATGAPGPRVASLSVTADAALQFGAYSDTTTLDAVFGGPALRDVVVTLDTKVDHLDAVAAAMAGVPGSRAATLGGAALVDGELHVTLATAGPTRGIALAAEVALRQGSALAALVAPFASRQRDVDVRLGMQLPVFGASGLDHLEFELAASPIQLRPNVRLDGTTLTVSGGEPATASAYGGLTVQFESQAAPLDFEVGGSLDASGQVTLKGDMKGTLATASGLNATDVWAEVGFGATADFELGLGGRLALGASTVVVEGLVDVDNPTDLFLLAQGQDLAFLDIVRAYNGLTPALPVKEADVPALRVANALVAIAPRDYALQVNGVVVRFRKGLDINASIDLLGLDDLNFTLALQDVVPSPGAAPVPDFIMDIDMQFADLATAFDRFMNSILPPHLLRPAEIRDIELFVGNLSHIIPQLREFHIDDFDLVRMAQGHLPEIEVSFEVFGKVHSFSFQFSLHQLAQRLGEVLKQDILNLKAKLGLPDCVVNLDCPGSQVCSHTSDARWTCVDACPAGTGRIDFFGCARCLTSAECSFEGSSGSCCRHGVCSDGDSGAAPSTVGGEFCGMCDFGHKCSEPISGCILGFCTRCITDLDCHWSGSAGHVCRDGHCTP